MSRKTGIDVFEEHTEAFRTPVGDSFIVTSRSRCESLGEHATIHAKAQDSFSLAYLLDNLPRHEFWSDDGRQQVPDLPGSSLHFMDLRAGGNARFGSTFDTLNMLIPRKVLAVLAEQIGCQPPKDLREPVAWTTRDPVIESFEQALLHTMAAGPAMEQLVADHLNLALVTHFAIRYGGMRKPSPSLLGALARWQLQRATEMMASDLTQRVSLFDVARHCDVSPSHFSRAFKVSTGLSPSHWMRKLRIDRAKHLLRESGASLTDVGSECGFADQAHFTRTFSRYVGVSPGSWRRVHRRT